MNDTIIQVQRAKELYEKKCAPEAVAIMRELLRTDSNNENYMILLALYVRALGQFDESLTFVDRVSPEMNGYPMLKGWHLLRQGKWNEGMKMRERELGIYRIESLYPFPAEKRFRKGTNLNGVRILLTLEGGNGDEIAYIRFAQILKARGATVIAAVSKDFLSIAERARAIDEVVQIDAVSHDTYDWYLPSMSAIDLLDIHNPSEGVLFPYIMSETNEQERWDTIAEKAANGRLKIGIQWQGNPAFDHVEFKTIPAKLLARFSAYGKLFLIQRPETITPDNTLPEGTDAFDTQTSAPSWESTLGAIDAMDVIIAGDTTITHMAGALGKKTFVLLPHAPHPYWADLKEISTWYPSVQVCRQPAYNDWEGAVRIAEDILQNTVSTTPPSFDSTTLLQHGEKAFLDRAYDKALAYIHALRERGYTSDVLSRHEAECHYNLGDAVRARDIMIPIQAKYPENSDYAVLLSQYFRALGQYEESLALLGNVEPSMPGYYALLGWHLLRKGQFLDGFRTLHHEINVTDIPLRYGLPEHKRLRPDMDIRGKTVFLVLDGGFGDQILSARFAQLFEDRGARVITGVTTPLLSIFKRIPFLNDIRTITEVPEEAYDYYLSGIWSLDILGIEDPKRDITFPYLIPDTHEALKLRPLIESKANGKLKIGIHWQGNLDFDSRERKSIRAAEMLKLQECGVLFSMQRDAGTNTMPEGSGVIDLQTGPASWEYTLAALSLMDVVVTNDSSMAHMASALGKKTAVLVSQVPSIYWLPFSPDSVWYPSARIFHQRTYNDWDSVLTEIIQSLQLT